MSSASKSIFSAFLSPFLRLSYSVLLLTLVSTAVAQPSADYAPHLEGTVFNVRDYGAKGDNVTDDTAAIRAAIEACRLAGGGTVYLPAGTYLVAPTAEGEFTFKISFGNVTIEGDGYDKTLLNFYAWGMQDPEGLILKRGGGFVINPPSYLYSIDGVTLRGFRATGNASPNADAGQWWGDDSLTGWDINHKGLGIWGTVTNVVVEDSEWDHWRGEIIYSGGGLELGNFTVQRCLINNSNASAISMGGDVLVEDTEIYAVHNGTECLSMGGHQRLTVRNCVIQPNRDLPEGVVIGKFGVVYLGYRESSLTVEDCTFGYTKSGAVFLSEFAHNVLIQNNLFQDTIGIYGIFLNMYKDYLPESYLEKGWTNFDILNNQFLAKDRSISECIVFYTSAGNDWRIIGNDVRGLNGNTCSSFIRTSGAWGEYLVKDNVIENANPVLDYAGPRPNWVNNTVTGYYANGTKLASYLPMDDPSPIIAKPTWPRIFVADLTDGVTSRELKIDSTILETYPVGFEIEIRRIGSGDVDEGIEVLPDPTWNTLERGYLIYGGGLLKLRMGESGLFELATYTPPTTLERVLTESAPSYKRNLQEITARGQSSATLSPRIAHTFNAYSGVALGDTISIHYNALTTIAHVPGEIEIYNGADFVASESGTLVAKRIGDVLHIVNPDNHAPEAGSATITTARRTPVAFSFPATDPDGDILTVVRTTAPTMGTFDFSAAPIVTFLPDATAMGVEEIEFTVSDGLNEASGRITIHVDPPTRFCDSDGDGAPDTQELLFGSDPDDAASRFEVLVNYNHENAQIELHLPAIVNPTLSAVLESSTNMTDWEREETLDSETLVTVGTESPCIIIPCQPGTIPTMFFRITNPETE